MNGALPPSSMLALTIRSAACLSSTRPTPVDPVKDTLRTRSSLNQFSTTPAASVVGTRLTTPSGTPAAERIPAIANAVSGVSAAGLSTTVHPAASAGAIFLVAIAAGKFHGVTSAATPTGLWVTTVRVPPAGLTPYAPSVRTASSENQRKNSAAYPTSARASACDLPFSAQMRAVRRSVSAIMRSKTRRRMSLRCRGLVLAQPGNARWAASTADRASAAVPSATSATVRPVAGSCTSNVLAAPRACPSMTMPCLASSSAITFCVFTVLPSGSRRRCRPGCRAPPRGGDRASKAAAGTAAHCRRCRRSGRPGPGRARLPKPAWPDRHRARTCPP
nr:hypothetical protein CPGR_05787 [Mycolicibacter nonchromogenicus]